MRNAMPFHVSLVGRKHLSHEIYRQIARAILDGRLRPGDRLSPSRELAKSLAVSRMTVTMAYERLAAEGFATSRQGGGTYVSDALARVAPATVNRDASSALAPLPFWRREWRWPVFSETARYDFRAGLPDGTLFPHRAWQRVVAQAVRSGADTASVYAEPPGGPDLRAAIARHIGFSRGVRATADDIVITNGTQQAVDLLARVLLAPGDVIAVEDPCYGPPRLAFLAMGLRVVGVPVDREGLVVARLPRGARAVYVTPSHQFPLGVAMSLRRRQALLAWAERNNAAIIEDDYDSEFRFGGRPLEPLQTIDSTGRVVYVGTFSKSLLPTVRLGFVVAPPSLRPALLRAKFVMDWHTPSLAQQALARFMEDGDFARHVRRMNRIYGERHALITRIITRDFRDHLELVPSSAGLHVTAFTRNATKRQLETIARRAGERGVAVYLLSMLAPKVRPGVILGYGAIATTRIREGLRILRGCFEAKVD